MRKLITLCLFALALCGCASEQVAIHVVLEPASINTAALKVGMSRAQLLNVCGDPVEINKTTSASGTREQFVYYEGDDMVFVYVENGKVTAWQE